MSHAVFKLSSPEKRDLWLPLAIFASFCIGFLFPMQKVFFLRPISISMVVVVTYYFGYLFKKNEARIPVNGFYAAACFMVLLISVQYGPQDTGGHQFIAPPFFLAASVCAFYTSYYAASVLERTTVLKNFMLLAGKNTIEIMSLHFIAFRLVNYLQVRIYDLPAAMVGSHPNLSTRHGWWAVYLVAGLALPLIAKAMYLKVKGYIRPRQQPAPY
jgi:fucose 4-O-acetylase-like acetyltransferase